LLIKSVARLSLISFLTFSCIVAAAQQTPAASNPEPSTQTPAKPDEAQKKTPEAGSAGAGQTNPSPTVPGTASTQGKVEGTSNDRLFYTLPNFLTLQNGGKVPPMTSKQKFQAVALGTFDYIQVPWYGFLSAISQAENSEPGFGQGWEGYGKRFGSALADGTIENFLTGAILPSILHQDPRFFQSSEGGFARRTEYAVSRIFITRTDSGHSQFNYSEVVGSAMSAAISTYSYHPRSEFVSTPTNPHLFIPSDRTLKNTASVWGSQVGYDTITIVVKEFWPDIHRKISKKHPAQPQ
jgi:hypothetical protein